MERAAPNTYREKENCHFADDTQLKVTFKEKTNGFRYYICPWLHVGLSTPPLHAGTGMHNQLH